MNSNEKSNFKCIFSRILFLTPIHSFHVGFCFSIVIGKTTILLSNEFMGHTLCETFCTFSEQFLLWQRINKCE